MNPNAPLFRLVPLNLRQYISAVPADNRLTTPWKRQFVTEELL
jgi:hypothetical protein